MANYVKLEWWNSCDLGQIFYADGYKNIFYYETEVGKPEYNLDQETEENGDGVDVVIFQVRKKIYQLEMFVPEYMVDALVDMALHDNIVLTYTNGLFSSTIRNVQVIPNWEDITNDCMATVVIKFQVDDQLVDSDCCTPLTVLACLETCLTVVGFQADHGGGYVPGSYYIKSSTEATVQQWTGVAFVTVACSSNYVFNQDENIEMYFNGTAWFEAPENTSHVAVFNGVTWDITVKGFALPNTFVQAYVSPTGVTYTAIGDPVTAVDFLATGISFTRAGATDYVKVFMYNHNCQYQYSNPTQP